jgi:uncharacterized protein (TIGR02145 family)
LKATDGWNNSPFVNLDTYGFSALPGGGGYPNGNFTSGEGYWWSSSEEYSSDRTYGRSMTNYGTGVGGFYYEKNYFFSVRCIKN